jgi:type IV pilus assembly protein PilC
MPAFEYKGIIGEKNTYTDGVIEAINEDEAAFRLREQKIIIISLQNPKKNLLQTILKRKKIVTVKAYYLKYHSLEVDQLSLRK